MKGMYGLNSGIGRLVKEAVFVACLAALMLLLFAGVGMVKQGRSLEAQVGEARRQIAESPVMMPGRRLTLGVSGEAFSLLIVTSPTCPFCVESATFHRELLVATKKAGLRLRVAVPTIESTSSFLASTGLSEAIAVPWSSLERRPVGVPSVVLIGSDGIIRRIWLGELKKKEQAEVLEAVREPAEVAPPVRKLTNGEHMLTSSGFRSLAKASAGKVVLISIEERESFKREHPEGAVNIPLAELGMRARSELLADGINAIDCSGVEDAVCTISIERTRSLGFRIVAVDFGDIPDASGTNAR